MFSFGVFQHGFFFTTFHTPTMVADASHMVISVKLAKINHLSAQKDVLAAAAVLVLD